METTTKTWSDTIEQVIQRIGETCKSYKWMNIFAAKNTSLKHNVLMYTIMVVGPLAALFETIDSINEARGLSTLQTLAIILSMLSGILSSIVKFGKFEEKTIVHKNIAAKYASLEGNIRRQLSLVQNDRVNAGKYLEWVSTSYDDLFASTPLMSDRIYDKWMVFAKENKLIIPEKLDTVVATDNIKNLEQLCATNNIVINKNNDDEKEEKESINIVVQGTDTIRRAQKTRSVYNSAPEFKQYGDQRMRYELNRLYGMSQ